MNKQDRLEIEKKARTAIALLYGCEPKRQIVALSEDGPKHEFDIYAPNILIGGVSTSTFKTSTGKSNTGGCDRASSELLWLSLWHGAEKRVHVLTDRALAEWLVNRYKGAMFPNVISIYHYAIESSVITSIGTLHHEQGNY